MNCNKYWKSSLIYSMELKKISIFHKFTWTLFLVQHQSILDHTVFHECILKFKKELVIHLVEIGVLVEKCGATEWVAPTFIKQQGVPVAYYSRKLNAAQRNYSTIKKKSCSQLLKLFACFDPCYCWGLNSMYIPITKICLIL